jgi:hypothetical protein
MPTTDGGNFDWVFAHPCLLVQLMVRSSPRLAERIAAIANELGDADWSIIIGYDEYTPGDFKRPISNRKSMNIMFSFLDFGAAVLCQNESWFIPASVRSERVSNVIGGWSHMFLRFVSWSILHQAVPFP